MAGMRLNHHYQDQQLQSNEAAQTQSEGNIQSCSRSSVSSLGKSSNGQQEDQKRASSSFLYEKPFIDPNSSNSLLREFTYRSAMLSKKKQQQQQQQPRDLEPQEEEQEQERELQQQTVPASQRCKRDSSGFSSSAADGENSAKKQKTEDRNNQAKQSDSSSAMMKDFTAFLAILADTMDDVDGNPFEPTPIVPSAISFFNNSAWSSTGDTRAGQI